jgi:hypothetical protein
VDGNEKGGVIMTTPYPHLWVIECETSGSRWACYREGGCVCASRREARKEVSELKSKDEIYGFKNIKYHIVKYYRVAKE